MDPVLRQRLVDMELMPAEGYSENSSNTDVFTLSHDVPSCLERTCMFVQGLAYAHTMLEKQYESEEDKNPGLKVVLDKFSDDMFGITEGISIYRGDLGWECPREIDMMMGVAYDLCAVFAGTGILDGILPGFSEIDVDPKPYATRVDSGTMPFSHATGENAGHVVQGSILNHFLIDSKFSQDPDRNWLHPDGIEAKEYPHITGRRPDVYVDLTQQPPDTPDSE